MTPKDDQSFADLTKASDLYERYLALAELAVEALPESESQPAPPSTDLPLGLVIRS